MMKNYGEKGSIPNHIPSWHKMLFLHYNISPILFFAHKFLSVFGEQKTIHSIYSHKKFYPVINSKDGRRYGVCYKEKSFMHIGNVEKYRNMFSVKWHTTPRRKKGPKEKNGSMICSQTIYNTLFILKFLVAAALSIGKHQNKHFSEPSFHIFVFSKGGKVHMYGWIMCD